MFEAGKAKRRLGRRQILRRLLVFSWLVVGVVVTYYVAFVLPYDGNVSPEGYAILGKSLPWAVGVFFLSSVAFGTYRGIWSLFSFTDCIKLALVYLGGGLVFAALAFVLNGFSFLDFPRSALFLFPLLLIGWEFAGRGVTRIVSQSIQWSRLAESAEVERSVILGNPESGDVMIRSLMGSRKKASVRAVFTGSGKDGRSTIRGIPVYDAFEDLEHVIKSEKVDTLVFIPPYTSPSFIRKIIDRLGESKTSLRWRIVPSIEDIATGVLTAESIRRVEIEDLIDRAPYEFDVERLQQFIRGRRVMVTGAGGSIGSEICRQLIQLRPKSLTLFELNEYFLFQIERELKSIGTDVEILACTGDVTRPEQVRWAMRDSGGCDIVYHAAAYKHVDMMERNPSACFHNNVIGTEIVVRTAEEEGVKEFVLVSTDKAVRPTSLMGSSKALAEKVLMERPKSELNFKVVRFGNVLGSSGSVVPIFREQIANGGPVTVTSRDVTRFFMTIPEAVELVLTAGSVDEDRKIFVLEMGEPVKIDVMARRMIELSGLVPDVDVPVKYIGLKPGEKEYEELLTDDENVVRTELDRIWVVSQEGNGSGRELPLRQLLELIDEGDSQGLREFAADYLPESRLGISL